MGEEEEVEDLLVEGVLVEEEDVEVVEMEAGVEEGVVDVEEEEVVDAEEEEEV